MFCYPSRNAARPLCVSSIDMKRNIFFQTAALVVAGIVLALVANAFASRDRKVSLVGTYPNALKVPSREAPAPIVTPVTQTVAMTTQPVTTTVPPTATTATQPTATAAIETVGVKPAVK